MVRPWWRFVPASGLTEPSVGLRRRLDEIGRAVDWRRFDKYLRWLDPKGLHTGGYPPPVVFRALLIQQWYALVAIEFEYCLADSISCRRFVGLRGQEPPPSAETVNSFRRLLVERGVAVEVFAELDRQLESLGLKDLTGSGGALEAGEDAVEPPPRAVQPLGPPEWTETETRLLGYWESKRGRRRMPGLTDVKLSEIPELQPHALLIRVMPEDTDFRYEFVGRNVVDGNASDPTGWTVNRKAEQNLRSYGHSGLQNELAAVYAGAVGRRRPVSTSTYFLNAGLKKCEVWVTVAPLAGPETDTVAMLIGVALIKPILFN